MLYLLQKEKFLKSNGFKIFFEQNKYWLVPYAAYCVLRDLNGTPDYRKWNDFALFKEEQIDAFFYKIHEAINQSLELGYQYGDIAVLCRYKKEAYAVAKYLTDHQIPVVSAESVLLAFSGAVQLLEAFLKLLHEDTPMHRYECIGLVHLHLAKQNLPNDVAATSSLLGASKTDFLPSFSFSFSQFCFTSSSSATTTSP